MSEIPTGTPGVRDTTVLLDPTKIPSEVNTEKRETRNKGLPVTEPLVTKYIKQTK